MISGSVRLMFVLHRMVRLFVADWYDPVVGGHDARTKKAGAFTV